MTIEFDSKRSRIILPPIESFYAMIFHTDYIRIRFYTDWGAPNQIPNLREGQKKIFDLPLGLEFDSMLPNPYRIYYSDIASITF